MESTAQPAVKPASLIVIDPSGHRRRVELRPLPFKIGRQADNHLVIRDSRASRNHAQVILENGEYILDDAGSRHGIFVNGRRVRRQKLHNSDRIDFGFPDSYQLVFAVEGAELGRLMDGFASHSPVRPGVPGASSNLAKLRAILEVARTLQTSFSLDDVLGAVVDAALAITEAERGFLLLRKGDTLEIRIARSRGGGTLDESELRVPRQLIHRALQHRRELLSMNFDPQGEAGVRPEHSIADLELRSVISVPLVRLSSSVGGATSMLSTDSETVGVIYMDSRVNQADLAGGNRELLQTLAIEASTILENARLLQEERAKQKIEEELNLARSIQQSLLPQNLPAAGWFRAAGTSVASHQVGGDYFDVVPADQDCWSAIVADVSGKGVGSALLASLLQGAFLTAGTSTELLERRIRGLNRFLHQRTAGEKYATLFCCLLSRNGRLEYVNAGHCPPLLLRANGSWEYLDSTSLPVGLLETAAFSAGCNILGPGDKLVIYTDGITEAQSPTGEYFGRRRLREAALVPAGAACAEVHDCIREALDSFIEDAPQADDMTLVVLEYRPE